MGRRKLWFTIAGTAVAIGLIALGVRGLNLGIDFKGGTQVTFGTPAPVALSDVRAQADKIGQSDAVIAQTAAVSAPNYSPLPIVAERAEGVWLWDVDGRKYLDCISAYSSLNQGHRHPRIIAALVEQAARLTLTSRALHNEQLALFYEDIASRR